MVWGKVYAFGGSKLSEIVQQHVSNILDQYCVYDLNCDEHSLKPETWMFVESDWAFYSYRDTQVVRKKKLEVQADKLQSEKPFKLGALMYLLKEGISSSVWLNEKDHILDKLAFMLRLEEDELVLDDIAWFFIQRNWIKAALEREELEKYKNEKMIKIRKNYDLRFDMIIHALEKCNLLDESFIEYKIALLLGISQEQFLSWQVKNQSHFFQNKSTIKQSEVGWTLAI